MNANIQGDFQICISVSLRYGIIKTCRWDFFNFSIVIFIGKYLKIRFKNSVSPRYFFSSAGLKIKNITKIEQKAQFLFIFLVSIFMTFLAHKLTYTIIRWFSFVFGLFFKQHHLLNLIILEVYVKICPKCAQIWKQMLL